MPKKKPAVPPTNAANLPPRLIELIRDYVRPEILTEESAESIAAKVIAMPDFPKAKNTSDLRCLIGLENLGGDENRILLTDGGSECLAELYDKVIFPGAKDWCIYVPPDFVQLVNEYADLEHRPGTQKYWYHDDGPEKVARTVMNHNHLTSRSSKLEFMNALFRWWQGIPLTKGPHGGYEYRRKLTEEAHWLTRLVILYVPTPYSVPGLPIPSWGDLAEWLAMKLDIPSDAVETAALKTNALELLRDNFILDDTGKTELQRMKNAVGENGKAVPKEHKGDRGRPPSKPEEQALGNKLFKAHQTGSPKPTYRDLAREYAGNPILARIPTDKERELKVHQLCDSARKRENKRH